MSKAFQSIKRGRNEAIAHEKGKSKRAKTYTPSEIDPPIRRVVTGHDERQRRHRTISW